MPNPQNVIGKGNRFKKGESGNPKGRPPMPDLKGALSNLLNERKDGMSALDAILKTLFQRALKGDVRAAQELLDRGYGKSVQVIDANIELEKRQEFQTLFPTKEQLENARPATDK